MSQRRYEDFDFIIIRNERGEYLLAYPIAFTTEAEARAFGDKLVEGDVRAATELKMLFPPDLH